MATASRHRRRLARLPALVAVGLLLAACTAGPLFRPDTHTVERGDTLYSIAWNYRLDWRKLARWNGIGPPYRIYPGQTLYLYARQPSDAAERQRDGSQKAERAVSDHGERPPDDSTWRWPANGEVLRSYSSAHARRGIDIAGSAGDNVRAAAAGRVVYSGSGLTGYGNLVIIKHDERYLSAYGFNRRLRVAEGDRVEAGQHIADLGLGPENRPMLYFEIRRDGEPVDPERLLPRK